MKQPKFWYSWKGQVIRAIAVDNIMTQREIQKVTGLDEEQFKIVLNETDLIKKIDSERFWVYSKELVREYRKYMSEQRKNLNKWFINWQKNKKQFSLISNHIFLEDRDLYDFSRDLLDEARFEVLVANPFVGRSHLSKTLIDVSKKRVPVVLITRSENRSYLLKMKEEGVIVHYNDFVHAKMIVVDRAVSIVSSMNLFSRSSGGGSWETGIVSIEEAVLDDIIQSIYKRIIET